MRKYLYRQLGTLRLDIQQRFLIVWIVHCGEQINSRHFGNNKLMMNWKTILLVTTIFAGCKKPYNPAAIVRQINYAMLNKTKNKY